MTLDQPADIDGELSWLDCEAGHRVRHPLIYPAIVRRVIGWTSSPGEHDKPYLRPLHDWKPQWIAYTSAPGQRPALVYREWTEPGPVNWERDWPQLIEGQRRIDRARAEALHLERLGVDTSWSVVSEGIYGNGGYTEHDIELRQRAVMPV
ncbi:hypothetical protein AB5J62_33675 [Amycolatopsis sp. cg5]|uniref:hypothetical protein n=1 Tax=Amycolatopsis sp. cg5 TaxID=3238802 RepID=UPI003523FBEC